MTVSIAAPRGGLPEVRPEILREPEPFVAMPLARALPWPQRLWQHGWLRKAVIVLVLAILWELTARVQDNELLLPSFLATARAFATDMANGELPGKAGASLSVLLRGFACGVALAFVLTTAAVSSRIGRDLLDTLTAMFNPLPAIALLPLALLWFGLGTRSLIFVLVLPR